MPEPRRANLRVGLAAACLLIAAGPCISQTVPTTPASGAAPVVRPGDDCQPYANSLRPVREARGRSALAEDFATIAEMRHPRGLASYLGRTRATAGAGGCDPTAASSRAAAAPSPRRRS